MSRYEAMFQPLRARGDGAFGAFVMIGDPDIDGSIRLISELVEAGADMLELGLPFSDPVADGPVIQAAAQRALAAGTRIDDCFRTIDAIRSHHPGLPIGILTYANLVCAPGRRTFFEQLASAGADSLLIADLPALEAAPWAEEMVAAGLDPVLIAASNTPAPTIERIAALTRGYTYCVTRSGITGTHSDGRFDRELLQSVVAAGAPPPVFGFGISRPDHVRAALQAGAAGVICGSAIVALAAEGGDAAALVRALKAATRNESAVS